MRSTGEVLGLSDSFGLAFYKALEGAKSTLPQSGSVLISVAEKDRESSQDTAPGVYEVAKRFKALGFRIFATRGTHTYLADKGIYTEIQNKLSEGRPNIEDAIKNKQLDMIINTPTSSKLSSRDDSYVRKSAIKHGVPYLTTLTAALAAAKGIEEKVKIKNEQVLSLQEYHQNVQ
jgi:carbamoyl-phosphate synthase large subunit